jgi:hypothetical protein
MAEEGQRFEAPDGNTLRLVRITDELLDPAAFLARYAAECRLAAG